MKFWIKSERRHLMNNQQNVSVFNYLTQVQSLFSQYIQIKAQLNLLENNLEALDKAFDVIPTQLIFLPSKIHGIRNIKSCNKSPQ